VTKAEANTLESWPAKLDGVDPDVSFARAGFNAACRVDAPFNPKCPGWPQDQGLAINKTNWANPLRYSAVPRLSCDDA